MWYNVLLHLLRRDTATPEIHYLSNEELDKELSHL